MDPRVCSMPPRPHLPIADDATPLGCSIAPRVCSGPAGPNLRSGRHLRLLEDTRVCGSYVGPRHLRDGTTRRRQAPQWLLQSATDLLDLAQLAVTTSPFLVAPMFFFVRYEFVYAPASVYSTADIVAHKGITKLWFYPLVDNCKMLSWCVGEKKIINQIYSSYSFKLVNVVSLLMESMLEYGNYLKPFIIIRSNT